MNAGLFRPTRAASPSESRAVEVRDVEMFVSETHSSALDAVVASVRAGTSLTVLAGDGGLGKSVVLNAAIATLAEGPEAVSVLKVSQPLPPPLDFQKLIGAPLGLINADRMTPNEIARRLSETPGAPRHVVLTVDDAQTLPPATLLYLRLVSDLFCVRGPLLQIVLCGRPALLETLQRPELAGRFVDSSIRVGLEKLSAVEMRNYIAYRLGTSGCTVQGTLPRGVLARVVTHAEGIPRRADQIIQRGLRRGPDGLCRPITMAVLRELGVTAGPAIPGGKAVWAGLSGVAAVAVLLAGLIAWKGVDRSRVWWDDMTQQASDLAQQAMGRAPTAAAPAAAPPPAAVTQSSVAPAAPAPATPSPAAPDAATADAAINRLLQAADIQIAAGQISGPADDNVMLTFQKLNDLIPNASAAARRSVETMNTHFAEKARAAEMAGRADEAKRFRQFAGDAADAPAPAPAKAAPVTTSTGGTPTLEVQPSAPAATRPGTPLGARDNALPLNAPTRVSLLFNRNNPDAEARAGSLAASLRDAGLQVARSVPVDRRATTLVVRYFFAEDRDGASLIARRLSGLVGQTASVELSKRDPMPVPGSVEALIP